MDCLREFDLNIFSSKNMFLDYFYGALWRCSKDCLIGALAAGSGNQGQDCHGINQIKKNEW
jgi:hypothetical protein